MVDLIDPVQRHIHAITMRDAIVPDDASDVSRTGVSEKEFRRFRRAMLPGVDFVGPRVAGTLDDPVGRRVGRVAFNTVIRACWNGATWCGTGPEPHRLPESAAEISDFIRQQTHLSDGSPNGDKYAQQVLGFSIEDHARISDMLRVGGAECKLFIAASMLSAECDRYEKARQRSEATDRHEESVIAAAGSVEATLNGIARIASDILMDPSSNVRGMHAIAMHLGDQVEAVRRRRGLGNIARAMRMAAASADRVHHYLTRGVSRDVPLASDRSAEKLAARLKPGNSSLEPAIEAMLAAVDAIDAHELYVLLMARRLNVALARYSWLTAPHPIFKLNYAYIGVHGLFAEAERLGAISKEMAHRQFQPCGKAVDSVTIKPVLGSPAATRAAIGHQTAPGRYLDLGVYHRGVTTSFIRHKAQWLAATVPSYTHHAYAIGSRFCDLAAAASHTATHDFMMQTELDKPNYRTRQRQPLVLFYGLNIEQMVILGLRQVLDRVFGRSVGVDAWRIAFGRVVHHILSRTAPTVAARLQITSYLLSDVTCKGINNRATSLASRFDDRDHDRPGGMRFDYALWFHRDRDVPFWDRLQNSAKLYGAFGSAFIPDASRIEREALPGRKGRRATAPNAPPSRWRLIMIEMKQAFDAYSPLYLKSRPNRLTAQIMARMSEGYSALASDSEFLTIF